MQNPTFAHVVNVTQIDPTKHASYLHIAQPVTLASMIDARDYSRHKVQVELYAIKHRSEQVEIPGDFTVLPDISHYAFDVFESLKNEAKKRPLPSLRDILNPVFEASRAEYVIYTNLDIGLYPHFYEFVHSMIRNGYDALCINRRTLPTHHEGALLTVENRRDIYKIAGQKHEGIDCFIFKREIIPSLDLGNVFVGYPPVGQVLKTQIEKNSKNFIWEKEPAVTFHLGDDKVWQGGGPYFDTNMLEAVGRYENCLRGQKPRRLMSVIRDKLARTLFFK